MTTAVALMLAACGRDRGGGARRRCRLREPPAVAARLATATTFRHAANDAAIWVDPPDPANSLLLVSGGEGGLEINELSGGRAARVRSAGSGLHRYSPATCRAGTALVDLVIASDQRLGAVRVYTLDAPARRLHRADRRAARSRRCDHRAVHVSQRADRQALCIRRDRPGAARTMGTVHARRARQRPASSGALPRARASAHCVADDAVGAVYFSEESVGIWRVAAEPESDAARTPVDLVEPRGTLHEEVKGLALYRREGQSAYLVAADAGAGAFNVYSLDGKRAGAFSIAGKRSSKSAMPKGSPPCPRRSATTSRKAQLIVADEDAGNYKLVAWSDIAQALSPRPRQRRRRHLAPQSARARSSRRSKPSPPTATATRPTIPAIWVDRRDPSRSVVIGTDKKLGLNVYDLKGKRLQVVADGRMNNVDLRDGFMLGGQAHDRRRRHQSHDASRSACIAWILRRAGSARSRTARSSTGIERSLWPVHVSQRQVRRLLRARQRQRRRQVRQWRLVDRNGKAASRPCARSQSARRPKAARRTTSSASSTSPRKTSACGNIPRSRTAATTRTADRQGRRRQPHRRRRRRLDLLRRGRQGLRRRCRTRARTTTPCIGAKAPTSSSASSTWSRTKRSGIDGSSETDGLDVVSAPLGADFPPACWSCRTAAT